MSDQVAIVTGAGTGIGKAIATSLLDAGFRLVLTGRRESVLMAAAQELGASRERILVHAADIVSPEAVDGLFAETVERFGRVDVLVNNAGALAPAVPIDELSPAQWQAVIDTNLTGAFLCSRAAFRQMKRQSPQGGRIINNGSVSASMPRPNTAPYTASKHGMTGLTRACALDGRVFNIACGQIDIGNAATDMTATIRSGVVQADGSTLAEPTFDAMHVGQAVAQMALLPLDANILSMTLMATTMPLVGRG